jgi:glycosyltransferase involved in cell wall biosynthesis/GT2 family glycosyltransferase
MDPGSSRALDISVVVPTYQRRASVLRLLQALEEQTLSSERFEAVVVVDGSTDGTSEAVAQLATRFRVRVAEQENRGRAAACNLGVRRSEAPIVLIIDDDMRPDPACLEAHLAMHRGTSARGVLGAVPVLADRTSPPVVRFIATRFAAHLNRLEAAGKASSPRDVYTGNFSIGRYTFLDAGGYDESFREYGNEDVELAARLLRGGVELVFSRAALAWQQYDKTFAQLARDNLAKGRTAVLCAAKHPALASQLRIGTYHDAPFGWFIGRGALLAASRIVSRLPTALLAVLAWVERRRASGLGRHYSTACDFFFWAGARAAAHATTSLESSPAAVVAADAGAQVVVHYTDTRGFGGAERMLLNIIASADRRRWRPVLLVHGYPGTTRLIEEATAAGVPVVIVPPMSRRRGLLVLPGFVRTLRGLRPAIFHAHLVWPLRCVHALVGARLLGIPAIATQQLYVPSPSRSAAFGERLCGLLVTRYLAVSREMQHQMRRRVRPADRVDLLHNAVAAPLGDQARADPLRRALLGDSGAALVLCVARLDGHKGLHTLVRAATHVPNAVVAIAGEGPERPRLEGEIHQHGVVGRVRLLGHRTDVPDLLTACDVFVLPSQVEGLPLALLEAMSAGKPVIATDIGGNREVVQHEHTGLLVPSDDVDALAAAMTRVLREPETASRMAREGQGLVRREFAADTLSQHLDAHYESVLAARPPAPRWRTRAVQGALARGHE